MLGRESLGCVVHASTLTACAHTWSAVKDVGGEGLAARLRSFP